MSRPTFDPSLPVLNPEALKTKEEEESDDLFDQWMEAVRAHPDPHIDDPERECPLFMTEIPQDPESIERNPALAAVQHLVHVEQTPQEIAEQFRDRGNEALRMATGVVGWKTARGLYTDGLRQQGVTAELRRILFANRAQVELNLGNHGNCIKDCIQSLKLGASAKAYFRCIKAASALEKWETVLQMCEQALKVPEMTPKEAALISNYERTAREALAAQRAREAARRVEADRRALPLKAVHTAIRQRQLLTGPPEVDSEQMATYTGDKQLAFCDDDGELHFPFLLLYDEHGVSDFVKDVPEGSCLREQLEGMFPPIGERPLWDTAGDYTLPNLSCFFFWDHRQRDRQEGYVPIDLDMSVAELLRQRVIYIPVPLLVLTFHIVPKDSELARRMRGDV